MPEEAYHLNPGTVLNGRYLIGRVLGFGGFGVTYMSLDLKLSRIVAIKEYFPTSLVSRVPGELRVSIFSGEKIAEYNKGLNRFLEEARNMAMFGNNPYIVNVLEFFTENRTAYIVMEYLDGETFEQRIKRNGSAISYEDALLVIKPVLEGLKVLHKNQIYHRDINPKNIMITKNNRVKIIDFGTAKFCNETEETISNVVTGGYAPPEQYQKKSVQGAYTDIYAVGATFYKAIIGAKPIDATDRQSNDTLQKPSDFIPELPRNIDVAIMKAMALKPEQRFQSTDEMLNALEVENNSNDYPEVEEHKRIVKRNIIIISALAAVIAAAITVLLLTQKSDALFKPMKSVIASAENVYLYVPYSTSDEQQELETNFEKISKDFNKYSRNYYGKDINVEARYIPENEYSQKITESKGTDSEVCLFRTDTEEIKDVKPAVLNELILDIDENMVFADKYKELYGPDFYKLPMGFYVYMMYIKALNNFDISNKHSWSSFVDGVPEDDRIIISKTSTPILYTSLTAEGAGLNIASDVLFRTLKDGSLSDISSASDIFINNRVDSFIGTTKDASKIVNSESALAIESRNVIGCGDTWYGSFDWEWSVSDEVSDSKRDASILFLRYCMSEEAQYDLCKTSSKTETILSMNKNVLKAQHESSYIEIIPQNTEEIHIISDDSDEMKFAADFLKQGAKGDNTKESIKTFAKRYFK